MFFFQGEYYYGEHDKEKMITYIMNSLDLNLIQLTEGTY